MAKKKLKIRAWVEGGKATVKAIIFHPMETGMRKDKATGKKIPAKYITEVKCEHNGKEVLTCLWGPGVSKNPFLSFRFKGAKKGDTLKISWVDNTGGSGGGEATIK
ncbi:MAG TPA: thiosulfate oxidation carrier complex protein SoxZ [Gammaproteobacteria bacterium]|nr:thiosulfate oxidation carrier complex protein SoxZ [Gammaproteobacteria bacterium]